MHHDFRQIWLFTNVLFATSSMTYPNIRLHAFLNATCNLFQGHLEWFTHSCPQYGGQYVSDVIFQEKRAGLKRILTRTILDKIRIVRCCVRLVLLYGAETCMVTAVMRRKRIASFEILAFTRMK